MTRSPLLLFSVRLALLAGLFLLASGCGGSSAKLYPVSGSVAMADGKALPFGVVSFTPDAEKGNKSNQVATGNLDANGAFSLKTNGKTGAPPGWYRVSVVTDVPGLTPPSGVKPPDIPAAYRVAASSPLKVEVVASPTPEQYKLVIR